MLSVYIESLELTAIGFQNLQSKKNKILSTEIIERQRHLIIDCRGIIYVHQSERFQKEIQVAFLGDHSISEWKETGISQLQNSCHYLMVNRGFECWET